MRRLFESGLAFIIVAALCVIVGFVAERGAFFISAGGFWFIVALAVRAKNTKKDKSDGES